MSTPLPTHSIAVPYAASLRAGDYVFTAGQVPRDADRQVIGTTIEEQTAAVFDKLRAALSAHSATLDHVVKMQVFLADIADWPRFNGAYTSEMGARSPVRTTVGASLNGVKVEIDAVAYITPITREVIPMSDIQTALAPSFFSEVGAPSMAQIEAAADRIKTYAIVTPLLESAVINEMTGGRILFKAEVLQKAGSFKFRGACNRLLQLTPEQRSAGIVAFSSGNHALATSAVAKLLNVKATIIMPADAPKTKIDGARDNGATVILYDRLKDDREAIGAALSRTTGAVTVPPSDDPYIMTGQATVGLEIMQQLAHMDVVADAVLAACSGGGLVGGVASAVRAISPGTRVYAVEPAAFDELARSLASGKPERNSPDARSICDALQVVTPGKLTFPVNQRLLAGSLTATDDEVREAMRVAFKHLKLVVEPGGAIGLAAILAGKLDVAGKTIVVILSGGNVDADFFADVLGA